MTGSRNVTPPPRIAVIGCGNWGANHLRVLDELGALATACDSDAARLKDTANTYPHVGTTSLPADVFRDPDVDAVIIATPASTHAALGIDALRAGKDVLVEKPLALSISDAEELCEIADQQARVLAVGHVIEYHPAAQHLEELVVSGALGRIRYMYANRLNFGRIRTEENVLWSFAPHDVAMMHRLMKTAPETVQCQGGSYLSSDVADVTLTHLGFGSGVRAHIYVSWLHPFKEHRFVVVGDQRMAVFDDTAPWPEKLVLYEHTVDWMSGQIPVARKASGEVVQIEHTEPLRAQVAAFIEAIRTRVPPQADGRSGLAVLRVLRAAQRSLESDGTLETLGLDDVYVHPTATVDPGASIGSGSKVWHYVHISTGARIGRNCVLGQNAYVAGTALIGEGVRVQNNVSVYDGVELGDGVFCGPSVVFTNVRNPRAGIDRKDRYERTVVGDGATLGANATIVCGNTIGRYAFVAAGAVVTKDVPDHALVAGTPAVVAGWACVCGERLPDSLTCSACGRAYTEAAEGLRETPS
jgi:UDP-2-acetamido-3-amino-2,3-dideoxy-glucuronate N-acetyltransferase